METAWCMPVWVWRAEFLLNLLLSVVINYNAINQINSNKIDTLQTGKQVHTLIIYDMIITSITRHKINSRYTDTWMVFFGGHPAK